MKMTAWCLLPKLTALRLAPHLRAAISKKASGITHQVRPTAHFPGGQSASDASRHVCVGVGASILVPVDNGVLSVLRQLWKPGPCPWHLTPLTIFVELAA